LATAHTTDATKDDLLFRLWAEGWALLWAVETVWAMVWPTAHWTDDK